MPRKGRNWTEADQAAWSNELANGERKRLLKRVAKGIEPKPPVDYAGLFELAFDQRTQLQREAFSLRCQMDEERKRKEIQDELAAAALVRVGVLTPQVQA